MTEYTFRRAPVTVLTNHGSYIVAGHVCGPLAVTPVVRQGGVPHRTARVVTHVATGRAIPDPPEWADRNTAELKAWIVALLSSAPDTGWWDRLSGRVKASDGWVRSPGKNKAERKAVFTRARELFLELARANA